MIGKWESEVVTTIRIGTLQHSKLLWWKQYICILCCQSQFMEWLIWKFVLLIVIYVRNVYHWKRLKICWHGTKWYHACLWWSKFIEERPEKGRAIGKLLYSVLCNKNKSWNSESWLMKYTHTRHLCLYNIPSTTIPLIWWNCSLCTAASSTALIHTIHIIFNAWHSNQN